MSEKNSSSTGGIGFLGLLTILFIGLKLTDNIDWSWWWVLSPSLLPFAVALVIFGGWVIVLLLVEAAKKTRKLWKAKRT